MTDIPAEQIQDEARTLLRDSQGLMLASVGGDGEPLASHAPFVLDDQGNPCIYVSRLADHTDNLLRHPRVSLLLARDQADSRNPFTRRRLSLACRAEPVAPETAEHERLLQRMEQRFGATVALLRQLGDFHLLRLRIESGSYVRGFGQAYDLTGPELTPISRKGGS